MDIPLTRRGLLGAAAGLTALGAGAASARADGVYEEQTLAHAGYKDVKNFRIPALAVAPNGDLLAGFDKRPQGGDSPAPNSIWQRRSTDGGRTWGDVEVVRAGNETGDASTQTGFSDPSYIVDEEAGRLFCFSVHSKDTGIFDGAYGDDDADRKVVSAALTESRDSGRTWKNRLITNLVKPEDCRSTFATSGAGIQLRYGRYKGRLVQQYAGFFRAEGDKEVVKAYSVYSDDHGDTWHMGAPVGEQMDENKVVELSDGTLMLNSRDHARAGHRWVAHSYDGGETWEDLHRDDALVDPGNNAHITRAHPKAPQGSAEAKVLLFSHADHAPTARENGTLQISRDDGVTWAAKRVFQPGDCGYSVVQRISDSEFGLFYEGKDATLVFARFSQDWILSR